MKNADCLALRAVMAVLLTLAFFLAPRAYGEADALLAPTEMTASAGTEPEAAVCQTVEIPKYQDDSSMLPMVVCVLVIVVSLVGIVCCVVALRKQNQKGKALPPSAMEPDFITKTVWNGMNQPNPGGITLGQLQHIGKRPYQEDSSGVAVLDDGVLAVVADGMGGLSGGDKVSQKIVCTMLEYSHSLTEDIFDGALRKILDGVNATVNQMLGPEGLQKSGSTLLAVLVRGSSFHWIAVGDSHIYLFHDGCLVQLNQEHNRGQELLRQAIAEHLTFDEVRADPKKSGLTSFIGMGQLRYVEKSLRSIPLEPGDRILLMTDGVFNALPDEEICTILRQTPNVTKAAKTLEQRVLSKRLAHQDNFTAMILGF